MTVAEQQYFGLLQAALWNTSVNIEGKIDWETVVRIAKHHGNDVLIGDVATRMNEVNAPAPAMLAMMQDAMRGNLFHQLQLKHILVSAVELLRQHGVEPVLLKGFSLARLYPNSGLRQFGDIDLYVGLGDFHQACTLLRSLPGGYNWGEEVDVGRHYNIEFGHYPMEIHRVSADVTNPHDQKVYDIIEQEGLVEKRQSVDYEGFCVSVPSDEFMVFFTFYHAWIHFLTTGVGWRQLSDVAMTLHTYLGQSTISQTENGTRSFDVEKLLSWLTAMHIMEPWQTFGWLLVEYLGLPETEMPFYDASCRRRAMKLYDRIMTEGNFRRPNRFKRRKPHGHLTHKIHSFIGIFVDFFQLANVFPTQAIRAMSTTLKNGSMKFFQKK